MLQDIKVGKVGPNLWCCAELKKEVLCPGGNAELLNDFSVRVLVRILDTLLITQ